MLEQLTKLTVSNVHTGDALDWLAVLMWLVLSVVVALLEELRMRKDRG